MMYPEAYKEWISIFDHNLSKIWKNERKELQKVAVLLCAFQNELKIVQTNAELELFNLKKQLQLKDSLEKRVKTISGKNEKKKSSPLNKENNLEGQLQEIGDMILKKTNQLESPDLFGNIDLNVPSNCSEISIVDLSLSEDDAIKIDGSPTIKKRRKRFRIIPKHLTVNAVSENNVKSATASTTAQESMKTNLFKSPVHKFDHDMSVIECTPEASAVKSKSTRRIGDFVSKKKAKKKSINTTLTQMFKVSSNRLNEKTGNGVDSDETFFEDNSDGTKMGITDLLKYINNADSKEQSNISVNDGGNESISQEMETSSQEVDKFSKGGIFTEEDLDTSSEKPKIVHIEPEPVVRGNARKQLRGWSCQQCKNFYSHMNLSPGELQKKMDECSRHRFKYAPQEETMPGGCLSIFFCKLHQVQRHKKIRKRIIIQKRNELIKFYCF